MAWEPQTGALWTVVNERDELGSDLVPDYLTSVQDGGFYGWPYSYYGQHVDDARQAAAARSGRQGDRARLRARPAHGLARPGVLSRATCLPAPIAAAPSSASTARGTASRCSGYKVIFVPFADGRPSGPPIDVLTGFVDGDGKAHGRPVGVAIDKTGALLVADDVGNTVWRVTPAAARAAER